MDPLQLFHNLVNLAAADQKFAEEEIQFLVAHAERHNIPNEEFLTAIHGIEQGAVEIVLPESHEDRVTLLTEMIKLMAVDGEVAEMEKRICAQASAKMDFTSTQFSELLDKVLSGEG